MILQLQIIARITPVILLYAPAALLGGRGPLPRLGDHQVMCRGLACSRGDAGGGELCPPRLRFVLTEIAPVFLRKALQTRRPGPGSGMAAAGSPGVGFPAPWHGCGASPGRPALGVPTLRGSVLHLIPYSTKPPFSVGFFPAVWCVTDTHRFGGCLFLSLGSQQYSFPYFKSISLSREGSLRATEPELMPCEAVGHVLATETPSRWVTVTLLRQGVGLGDPQRSLPTPTIL